MIVTLAMEALAQPLSGSDAEIQTCNHDDAGIVAHSYTCKSNQQKTYTYICIYVCVCV